MYIRCLKCRGVKWIERAAEGSAVRCNHCTARLHIRNPAAVGGEHTENVARFAEAGRIDLPSANSVLLGVMTLDDALAIQGASDLKLPVDTEKIERRAREALRRLESSDNPVAAVLLTGPATRARKPIEMRTAAIVAAAMLVATTAVALSGWSLWKQQVSESLAIGRGPGAIEDEMESEQVGPTPSTRVIRNRSGAIVRITDTTPEGVLRQFCDKVSNSSRFTPIEIAATEPPRKKARLGLIRDFHDLGKTQAIWIRLEKDGRRWVAGDGKQPLSPYAVPEEQVGETQATVDP